MQYWLVCCNYVLIQVNLPSSITFTIHFFTRNFQAFLYRQPLLHNSLLVTFVIVLVPYFRNKINLWLTFKVQYYHFKLYENAPYCSYSIAWLELFLALIFFNNTIGRSIYSSGKKILLFIYCLSQKLSISITSLLLDFTPAYCPCIISCFRYLSNSTKGHMQIQEQG